MDASYRLGDDEADNGRGRSEASLDLRSGVLFEGIPSRLRSPIKKKMTKNLFLVTLFTFVMPGSDRASFYSSVSEKR